VPGLRGCRAILATLKILGFTVLGIFGEQRNLLILSQSGLFFYFCLAEPICQWIDLELWDG
jgi:hypothetical protein